MIVSLENVLSLVLHLFIESLFPKQNIFISLLYCPHPAQEITKRFDKLEITTESLDESSETKKSIQDTTEPAVPEKAKKSKTELDIVEEVQFDAKTKKLEDSDVAEVDKPKKADKSITEADKIEEIELDVKTNKVNGLDDQESDKPAAQKGKKGVLGKETVEEKSMAEEEGIKQKKAERTDAAPSKQKGESEGINNSIHTQYTYTKTVNIQIQHRSFNHNKFPCCMLSFY